MFELYKIVVRIVFENAQARWCARLPSCICKLKQAQSRQSCLLMLVHENVIVLLNKFYTDLFVIFDCIVC